VRLPLPPQFVAATATASAAELVLLCWIGDLSNERSEESGAFFVFTARIASFLYMEATQVQSFCSAVKKSWHIRTGVMEWFCID
jgi:hypothetical protein